LKGELIKAIIDLQKLLAGALRSCAAIMKHDEDKLLFNAWAEKQERIALEIEKQFME